jgi:hypothetical protein
MAETTASPDWFDDAKHVAGPGGIYEVNTGVLLGEDGQPASAALRSARAAIAAVASRRKPRDTRQIVEGAAAAAAQKE